MEWIDGVKLTNSAAMDANGQSITDFVDVGIECTLRQLLEHGYFHADPHPGVCSEAMMAMSACGIVGNHEPECSIHAAACCQACVGGRSCDCAGNLLATPNGDLCYLDFGMMSEAPEYARTAIIAHVVHLVNRDYEAMCRDYYTLQFICLLYTSPSPRD